MRLKTNVGVAGKYKFEAAGFDFIADYTCVSLFDNATGMSVDLNEGNGYCFTSNVNDSPDRFILTFSKNGDCKSLTSNTIAASVDFENHVDVLPSAQGNTINFYLQETANTTISVSNMLGQNIVENININAIDQSVNIALPEGYSGMYIIKVESDKGSITKKFVRK